MKLIDVLITALLVLCVGLVFIKMHKDKKQGKCHCGCDGCSKTCGDRK